MKALSKLKPEPGIWMVEAPIPTITPDQLLIKIRKTAICGTDIHIYQWDDWAQNTIKTPLITGHEFVGEIVEVGENVKDYQVGEIVSGEGHIVCGRCRNCRTEQRHLCPNTLGIGVNIQGAFAEYMAFPASNAFRLPPGVTEDEAAVFDPLGNATHTALSYDCVGEDVLVTGAGPVGLMGAAIAKKAGARYVVITDVNDYRLELAQKMGVDRAVNVTKTDLRQVMNDLGMTEGFDIGLEMSGNVSALGQMLDTIIHGGKVMLLGILPSGSAIDWPAVIFKGLTIKGIYGREMYSTWYKMASMIQSGLDIKSVITHQFTADEFQHGFEVMASGQSGKVILNW